MVKDLLEMGSRLAASTVVCSRCCVRAIVLVDVDQSDGDCKDMKTKKSSNIPGGAAHSIVLSFFI